jgi:hypothetical protein
MVNALLLVAVAVSVDEVPAVMEVGFAVRVTTGLAVVPLKFRNEQPVRSPITEAKTLKDRARQIEPGTDAFSKVFS